MKDKPTGGRHRTTPRDGAVFVDAPASGVPSVAQVDAPHPLPRAALRLRKIVVAVFGILTIAGGAGLSAIPFSPREVTRMQRVPSAPITQPPIPMRMEQTGRGIPFQVYVMERGPIEAAIRTNAIINAHTSGIALNMLVAALAQLILLGLVGAWRRKR